MSGLRLRYRLAVPARAVQRLVSRFRPPPPGAFRVLLFHDIPLAQRDAFTRFARWATTRAGVITPDEAAARLDGHWPDAAPDGRVPFLFTFDDGFVSNGEVAREILDPLGIRALFFVCPGLVDLDPAARSHAVAENVFRGRGRELPAGLLMGWTELGVLAAAGHTIGSHGLTHRRLVGLSADELDGEIAGAADRLRAVLDVPVDWFAFTFGDVASASASVLATVACHHRYCRSGVRGPVHAGLSHFAVRADHIDLDGPDAYRHFVAEGGLDGRYREARRRLDAMASGL